MCFEEKSNLPKVAHVVRMKDAAGVLIFGSPDSTQTYMQQLNVKNEISPYLRGHNVSDLSAVQAV